MSKIEFDPYSPPMASLRALDRPADSDSSIFRLWEKYRLIYNATLTLETMTIWIVAPPAWGRLIAALEVVGLLAIAANVCFCAGPVAHFYAANLGFQSRWIPRAIMALGTTLSVGLAFGSLMMIRFPKLAD